MMSNFSGQFKRHAQCNQLKVSQLASSSSLILTFSLLFFTGTISHFNIWSQWRNINDLKSSCGSTEFGDLIDWRLLQTGARGEVITIRPDNYSCKCSTLLAVIPLLISLYSGQSRETFQVLLSSLLIFAKPFAASSLQIKFTPECGMVIEFTKSRSDRFYMNVFHFGNLTCLCKSYQKLYWGCTDHKMI